MKQSKNFICLFFKPLRQLQQKTQLFISYQEHLSLPKPAKKGKNSPKKRPIKKKTAKVKELPDDKEWSLDCSGQGECQPNVFPSDGDEKMTFYNENKPNNPSHR